MHKSALFMQSRGQQAFDKQCAAAYAALLLRLESPNNRSDCTLTRNHMLVVSSVFIQQALSQVQHGWGSFVAQSMRLTCGTLPEGWESGSLRSASSWRPLGTGEEVVWDAKREGRRVVLTGGLPEAGDLAGPRCRIFHPPETSQRQN